MSSQEKIQIQMTLLKELAARDKPFVHQNDKTFFLRDFYQRCGVSKLFHQLVADFFHNNIQRGSCPKWARSDPCIRDMFARVREVYGAMQPSRHKKNKSETTNFENFTKQLDLMTAQGLGASLLSSSSAEENNTENSSNETDEDGNSNKGLSNLDILEKLCFNIETENVIEPLILEENSQNQLSPQPKDLIFQLNQPSSSVTKTDFDRLNRKVSEVLRNQKKMAADIAFQNKTLQELKEILNFMGNSLLPTSSTGDGITEAATVNISQMYGSPDSLPHSYEGSTDSPKVEETAMAVVNQLLNNAQANF